MSDAAFPFDLFARALPGMLGTIIQRVRDVSMFPPYPWGQWTYGRLFQRRCADLPGDILEAGVGMGGMSFFFAMLLGELGDPRQVISVDSFEGLPAPDRQKDNPYFVKGLYRPNSPYGDPLAPAFSSSSSPGLESFRARAQSFKVEDRVVPLKGFFDEVLPKLPSEARYAFVHIDGDLFDSVYGALEQLWDRVVDGGVVAIDDFFHPSQGPLRAAAEFFNSRGETPVYHVVLPYSTFVIKEEWPRRIRAVDGNVYSLEWLRNDAELGAALRSSLKRSRKNARARSNCRLLKECLEATPYDAEIYDYWRALEQFWYAIDANPDKWVGA